MKPILLTSTYSKSHILVLISAIAVLLFSASRISAQENSLTVITETHTSGKAFKGYMVTVYEDLLSNGNYTPIDQFMANSAKLKFKMKYNSDYMIDFATPADLHYTAEFNTHMATSLTNLERKFEMDIDFDKLDINEYPNTVETVFFNEKAEDFAFKSTNDSKIQQAAAEE